MEPRCSLGYEGYCSRQPVAVAKTRVARQEHGEGGCASVGMREHGTIWVLLGKRPKTGGSLVDASKARPIH